MTEHQLELLRIVNHNLLERKKETIAYQQEKEKLENDPTVRKYLEILEKLENNKESVWRGIEKLSDNEILERATQTVIFSDLNGIYVYMGSYKINKEINSFSADFPVPCNSIDEDYKVYRSVELNPNDPYVEKRIYFPCDQAKFEEDNIVLYPDADLDNNRYYADVRNIYFKEAVSYGENQALVKMLDLKDKCRKK